MKLFLTLLSTLLLIGAYVYYLVTKKKRANSDISAETAKKRYVFSLIVMGIVFVSIHLIAFLL